MLVVCTESPLIRMSVADGYQRFGSPPRQDAVGELGSSRAVYAGIDGRLDRRLGTAEQGLL